MKISKIFSGIVLTMIGLFFGFVDYFIISVFYGVSSWIASLANAPEVVALLLTIILIAFFFAWILIIGLLAIYIIIIGISNLFYF